METITLKVTGMTCGHCVAAVTKALQKIPGVDAVEVTLEPGQAVVTGSADPQALVAAIQDEGYGAELRS